MLSADTKTLVKKILENLNGKHIYDNVFSLTDSTSYTARAIAAALDIDVIKDLDEFTPFTLVVDLINDEETRKKFWDWDYACLYSLSTLQAPTYSVRELDKDTPITQEAALEPQDHVRGLLAALGEDVNREGLQETPKRVIKFYKEFLNTPNFNFTAFENEGTDQMIVQKDIAFFSLCEHHLAPFFGTAKIAYIPDEKIVGLSKLARTVQLYANNFQNQERITNQIADRLEKELHPLGVAVQLTASHLCMEMRGVKTHGTTTTTTKVTGGFKDNISTRQEFLNA